MSGAASTRASRVVERKRKQEALEAAKARVKAVDLDHVDKRPRRDEIALSSDHLTCPICREILENAVETACSHVYCENCVALQIANGHKKCAVCRAPIRSSDLRPSVPIRRIVSDMDTTCTNAECKWKGTRGNLQDHELMCGFALVSCEYGHEKCGTLRRMDLKKHHLSECLYFICKCTLKCGQSFPRRELSRHKKTCPNARVKCEQCAQSVRRKELPHHADHVCPKSKVKCFAGCKGTMLREQLGGHILSNLGPHLCALVTSARIGEQENRRLTAKLAEQAKALAALAETVAELKSEAAGAPAEEDEEDANSDGSDADVDADADGVGGSESDGESESDESDGETNEDEEGSGSSSPENSDEDEEGEANEEAEDAEEEGEDSAAADGSVDSGDSEADGSGSDEDASSDDDSIELYRLADSPGEETS